MMTSTEEQNLAIVRIFIEQFLGKGNMAIAADVLAENVQAITGLKPDGPGSMSPFSGEKQGL